MPRFQTSSSWKVWVPQPITFTVLVIHRFLGGAEALQKRLHRFHWYETRQRGRTLHQIVSCTCPHHRLGSQTATNAVSRVLDWLCHCLRSTWSARAEGQASQWWAAARAPLAQHVVLARVLHSPSALDCLIRTLSVFDGVVISIKNSSWRTADAPTLIESCQSVVYLTTSDTYASRRWLLGCSASQWSAYALFINLQYWCLPEHCAWCVSLCAYAWILMAQPCASVLYVSGNPGHWLIQRLWVRFCLVLCSVPSCLFLRNLLIFWSKHDIGITRKNE